jgi:hypothetical protein
MGILLATVKCRVGVSVFYCGGASDDSGDVLKFMVFI